MVREKRPYILEIYTEMFIGEIVYSWGFRIIQGGVGQVGMKINKMRKTVTV